MISPVFEWAAEGLENVAGLSRSEARGTVRLALREVGLTVTGVTRRPMLFVVDNVFPRLLQSRGVRDPGAVCAELGRLLQRADLPPVSVEDADVVFARLGGDPPSDPSAS